MWCGSVVLLLLSAGFASWFLYEHGDKYVPWLDFDRCMIFIENVGEYECDVVTQCFS